MKEQPQKPETLKDRIANLEDPGNEREVLIETLIFMNETLEHENTALTERFRYIRDAMEDIARHSEEERIKEYAEKCLETLNRLEVK